MGQTWAIMACFFFAAFGFVAVAWWAVGVRLRIVHLEARIERLEMDRSQHPSGRV
jgi:hypothetical protein